MKQKQEPRPLNVPLFRALWPVLDSIWGVLKGSWGVLEGKLCAGWVAFAGEVTVLADVTGIDVPWLQSFYLQNYLEACTHTRPNKALPKFMCRTCDQKRLSPSFIIVFCRGPTTRTKP